jgi:hypothetical protein
MLQGLGYLQSSTNICTTLMALFFIIYKNFIRNDHCLQIKLLYSLFFKKNCCIIYLRSLIVHMRHLIVLATTAENANYTIL